MRISDWSSDVCSSDLFVAGFAELLDDVADLARAEELRFLDVDDAAGFCERHHEVGLSREKGRELQNVDDFGDWRGLQGSCTSRSEEHTSELQSLMRISYAVFCLQKKK